jgi:ABC-type multidrug transport system ATPase subunit
LFISHQNGVIVVDMASEVVLFKQLTVEGNFTAMAVSGGDFRTTAYVVGVNQKNVWTWKLMWDAVGFSCTRIVAGTLPAIVTDMVAVYDPQSAAHWAGFYYASTRQLQWFNPTVTFATPLQQWNLALTSTTTRVNLKTTFWQQNDFTPGALPLNIGCFAAVPNSIFTLVMIYTNQNAFIFGLSDQNNGVQNLDLNPVTQMGTSLFFQTDAGEELTAANIYGDCIGLPSGQSLYLQAGISTNGGVVNYIRFVPLPEFSEVDSTCFAPDRSNWWRSPAGPRKIGTTCTPLTATCGNWKSYRQNSDQNCVARALIPIQSTFGPIQEILSALSTDRVATTQPADLEFAYQTIVFGISLSHIDIFAVQEIACLANAIPVVTQLNRIAYAHNIFNLAISTNGQHIFTALDRRDWEIVGYYRLIEICNSLASNPNQPTLARFANRCNAQTPTPLGIYDFITYHSQCHGGWSCPLFGSVDPRGVNRIDATVGAGQHTIRPLAVFNCEPGYYCPGVYDSIRYPCPPGFKCPNSNMKYPIQCNPSTGFDTGCVTETSTGESPCPAGQICKTEHTALPSPPGYFVNDNNRKNFIKCGPGRFCPLMNNSTTSIGNFTLCPAGYYCPDSISVPIKCITTYASNISTIANFTQYCPQGSALGLACPAGFECSSTNTIVKCENGYYCPNGTQIAQPCPAGYFCRSPDQIQICPWGFYCTSGSVGPTQCQLMVYCGVGTKTRTLALYVVLLDAIIIILALIALRIFITCCNKIRKRRRNKKILKRSEGVEPTHVDGPITPSVAFPQRAFTVDYEFSDLQWVRKKNKQIVIDNVKGKISHGKVTAILSSDPSEGIALLDILTGRDWQGWTYGDIKVNGNHEKGLSNYKNYISYVSKEDVLYPAFKIREEVRFTAQSRLPITTSPKAMAARVENVLRFLDLQWMANKHCGVGGPLGFSDHQYKKIHLATELVTDPSVIALDNPFVGDLKDQMEMMGALKKLAAADATVICVLTNPRWETFKHFDDCIVLGRGGQVVYNGPSKHSLQYFQELGFKFQNRANPVDIVSDIIKGTLNKPGDDNYSEEQLPNVWKIKQQEINKPWTIEPTPDAPTVSKPKRSRSGCLSQYFLLSFTTGLQLLRHLKGIAFEVIFTILVASLIGGLFFNMEFIQPLAPALQARCPLFLNCTLPISDNIALISLISILGIAVVAIQASEKIYGVDKAMYQRHVETGGSKLAYFLAKQTSHLPTTIVLPFIYTVIWYLFVTPRQNFGVWLGIFLLMFWMWTGFGYLMTIALPREHGVFFAFAVALLSGTLAGWAPTLAVLTNSANAYYTWSTTALVILSPPRWALELMYVSEISFYRGRGENVTTALSKFGFDSNFLKVALLNVFMLILFGVLFRIIAFIVLYFQDPAISTWFKYLYRSVWRKTKKSVGKGKKKKKTGLTLQESLKEAQKLEEEEDDEVVLHE